MTEHDLGASGTGLNLARHKDMWDEGIVEELRWWREWLSTESSSKWKQEVQDANRPIHDHLIAKRLAELQKHSVSILEFGSGPAGCLGQTYPGKDISVVAVDALANAYHPILKEYEIYPATRPVAGYGEHLDRVLGDALFDIVYACNAVDHTYDPIRVMDNLIRATNKGGLIVLRHYINEGQFCNGVHQWNFVIQNDHCILWDTVTEYDISERFSSIAEVRCHYEKNPDDYGDWFSGGWKDWVVLEMLKK